MVYKEYQAIIEFDDEAKLFHGEVVNTNDVITFQGTSVEELEKAFQDSVDDYLAWCEELGEEPEKPFSGKFVIRIDPDIHRKLSIKAKKSKQSINTIVIHALERELVGMV